MKVFCLIDYHVATPAIAATAKKGSVYKEQRFSDHALRSCPLDVMDRFHRSDDQIDSAGARQTPV
jgi:hypothetical protein